MPTQRGTSTTEVIYFGWPIDAPTGLADGDVVYIGIFSDGSAPTAPLWALAGFDTILEVQSDTSQVWLSILRGTISGTPPSGFSPAAGAGTPGFWQASCLAFYDADPTNEVVGTPFESSSPGAGPVDVPGITVVDDGSVVLLYSLNRFGSAPPTGWTTIYNDDHDVFSDPFDSGPTGNVPIANTQAGQPTIGVLVSVPPVSAASDQTWVGSTGTVVADGVSAPFTATATWTGSTGTIALAGVSGAFVPGAVTWSGSVGAAVLTGVSGSFDTSTTWAGSTGSINAAGISGTFTPGTAAWSGSTGSVTFTAATGTFVAGGVTWAGSLGSVTFTGQSGQFGVPGDTIAFTVTGAHLPNRTISAAAPNTTTGATLPDRIRSVR